MTIVAGLCPPRSMWSPFGCRDAVRFSVRMSQQMKYVTRSFGWALHRRPEMKTPWNGRFQAIGATCFAK